MGRYIVAIGIISLIFTTGFFVGGFFSMDHFIKSYVDKGEEYCRVDDSKPPRERCYAMLEIIR